MNKRYTMYERGKAMMEFVERLNKENKPSVRPKKVVSFLLENKIVFLRSIYHATKNPPKWVVFYELFEDLVPQTKRFN